MITENAPGVRANLNLGDIEQGRKNILASFADAALWTKIGIRLAFSRLRLEGTLLESSIVLRLIQADARTKPNHLCSFGDCTCLSLYTSKSRFHLLH